MEFAPGVASEMHRTETIDYIVVLAGAIDMDMDETSVKLRAGDVMVQRGTNHAWINRGKEPARLAIVLLDAKPLGIGHPRVRGQQAR
jgi:quercetin dioxygenase-like cupin family protein